MTGPWRDRHDPTSPKANKHWSALYAAGRRAIDRIILAEARKSHPKRNPRPRAFPAPRPRPRHP